MDLRTKASANENITTVSLGTKVSMFFGFIQAPDWAPGQEDERGNYPSAERRHLHVAE